MKKQFQLLPVFALTLFAGCQTLTQPVTVIDADPAASIVASIESNLAADRLTIPEGNNVMVKLDQLASRFPDDPRIAEYRSQVVFRLVQLGQKAFLDGQLYHAKQLAIRALEINPHHAEAGYILTAIAEARRPPQIKETGQLLPTESFEIENVEDTDSVNIITVSVPDLETVVTGTDKDG